jgi:hypothetical protein
VANELFQDASHGDESYLAPLHPVVVQSLATFWDLTEGEKVGLRPLSKFQAALRIARVEPFETGRRPYQDAKLVVELRNALMHYKPETLSAVEPHQFRKALAGKFPPDRLIDTPGNPFFPDKCLGAGCAAWAVQSSKALADAFFARLGIQPNHQRVSFGTP